MKFTSILKDIILESSRFEVLRDALTKPTKNKEGKNVKPKMPLDVFIQLVQADPTSRMNNVDPQSADSKELEKIKAGSYTNWLIKNYLNPQTEEEPGSSAYSREVSMLKDRFIEDLYKVTIDLKKFDKFKNRLPKEIRDINKLTPQTLYDNVKDFSLEKTKASKEEKEAAKESFEYPGATIAFKGKNWTVAKISERSDLGFDAACWYGGYHLESHKGETRWCTSSPGYPSHFNRYLSEGPLYVILPNNYGGKRGEKTGLPAERYQFHFPSNQFMNPDDRQINLIEFLNGPMSELKEFFKPEFAKGLTISGGAKLNIESFSSGAVGRFISLYGLNDLFDNLPNTLEEIVIKGDGSVYLEIPKTISKFKKLNSLLLENCIDKLPDEICSLKNTMFLSFTKNPNLREIPECIVDMPELYFLNVQGCPNLSMPDAIKKRGSEMDSEGSGLWNFKI